MSETNLDWAPTAPPVPVPPAPAAEDVKNTAASRGAPKRPLSPADVKRVIAAVEQTAALDTPTRNQVAKILGCKPDTAGIVETALTGQKPPRTLTTRLWALIKASDQLGAYDTALELLEGDQAGSAWRIIAAVAPSLPDMPRKTRDAGKELVKAANKMRQDRQDQLSKLLDVVENL